MLVIQWKISFIIILTLEISYHSLGKLKVTLLYDYLDILVTPLKIIRPMKWSYIYNKQSCFYGPSPKHC